MEPIQVEIRGLFCSLAENNNVEEINSLFQDICNYLPTKYVFIKEIFFGGMRKVDTIIEHEDFSQKIKRLVKFRTKPKVVFDKKIVRAIAVEPLYTFLDDSIKNRVIGISNTDIHDGEKFFGGLWSSNGKEILESIPYWQRNLEVIHRFSRENLVVLLSKSCVHEIAESFGCRHHASPKGCVMDIGANAFERPENLCSECMKVLNSISF